MSENGGFFMRELFPRVDSRALQPLGKVLIKQGVQKFQVRARKSSRSKLTQGNLVLLHWGAIIHMKA
jgi:hypothetical protein